LVELHWTKSSFSSDTGACVEVAGEGCSVFLRESDDPGVMVRITRRELRAFLEGVKAGESDDRM
jgi:hypothetical protein